LEPVHQGETPVSGYQGTEPYYGTSPPRLMTMKKHLHHRGIVAPLCLPLSAFAV
jgi:hypothetical protein